MANSRFEYVRLYETATDYRLPIDNYVVVRVQPDCAQFQRLAVDHKLLQPNDKRCLDLCNKSALVVMRTFYPNILVAYGHSHQFSFIFRPFASMFNRRQNKIVSLVTSTFTSAFAYYWLDYFRNTIDKPPCFFTGRVILFGSHRTLVDYLRDQYELCHQRNLDNTTLAAMTGVSLSKQEAQAWLAKASKADKNEKLFTEFGINYNDEPEQFKKGTVIVYDGDMETVEADKKASKLAAKQFSALDVAKQERMFKLMHANLKTQSFWDSWGRLLCPEQSITIANTRPEYVRDFERATNNHLPMGTYIVVRIDGQSFHRLSKEHNFLKPNDKRSLDLMNKAAVHVMNIFTDHVLMAYGQSDEFSFILPPTSNLLKRNADSISSAVVCAFTSAFVHYWSQYFGSDSMLFTSIKPQALQQTASFDSRCVVYANRETIEDYVRWRQADCHINNLYNTTFHALTGQYCQYLSINGSQQFNLKSMPSLDGQVYCHQMATERLAKTLSRDKKKILLENYNIVYEEELEQFRRGSFIVKREGKISIEHVDLIKAGADFWNQLFDCLPNEK